MAKRTRAIQSAIELKRRAKEPKYKERRGPRVPPTEQEAIDICSRASSIDELKVLWHNIFDMGLLTPEVKHTMDTRAGFLKRLERK